MTGYRSSHFRWNCEDKGCYHEQLPNWDDLIECLPRGIAPTDVDGMVHIAASNSFLFLEQKSPGKSLEHGQAMALRGLCKLPGVTAVIFRPAVAGLECLVYSAGGSILPGWEPHDGFQVHSREDFRAWLREWVRLASKDLPVLALTCLETDSMLRAWPPNPASGPESSAPASAGAGLSVSLPMLSGSTSRPSTTGRTGARRPEAPSARSKKCSACAWTMSLSSARQFPRGFSPQFRMMIS